MQSLQHVVVEGIQLRLKVNREPCLRDYFCAKRQRLVFRERIGLPRLCLIAGV